MRQLLLILALLMPIPAPVSAQRQPPRPRGELFMTPAMRRYDTPYYIVFTDMGDEVAREASIRLSRMAEVYHERTREFSGAIREKFPFFLYAQEADYHAAGGREGSGGMFTGSRLEGYRLMAFAQRPLDGRTWHVVQHEGFHQFARAVIGGDLPIWVNEGLAEYFGEALFTGDGYVTGVIPPWRLERVQRAIADGRFMSIPEMMMLSHDRWNAMLDRVNYDQAWAMVHFLAHAEDGRYQKAFGKFMNAISRGAPWEQAWLASFGSAKGFEEKFNDWWRAQPRNASELLYAKATALTLAGFLARAHQQGQAFEDFEAFQRAAAAGELKSSPAGWLPPSILTEALEVHDKQGRWSLEKGPTASPRLVITLRDGATVSASFTLKGEKVESVKAEIDELPRAMAEARKMAADGRKTEARQHLAAAIKANPRSPSAAEARKLAAEIR